LSFVLWRREYAGTSQMTSSEESRLDGSLLGRVTFPAVMEALPDIRRLVRAWATGAGLDPERTYDLQLAVNEACANAMEHPKAQGDLTLWAWRNNNSFTIDVWHPGEFRVSEARNRSRGGFGLPLMVRLADRVVFVTPPDGGTRVSLSFFLPKSGG
jgi:anti-sigma regulatory factor (Ser/Thr protein kinase)